MTVRVGLHRFESDPGLAQRDGVNLAHTEINRLLGDGGESGLSVDFHDFDRLLRDDAYAMRTLSAADCVLCNVGPHAHYYHHLRERLGLDFRIVRDIKTALWSGYLLQESLCQPYLRDGDALLATSNYSRVLTRHLFPHLRDARIDLFEPVLAASAGDTPAAPRRAPGPVTTLGYVGRLSEDKNFPQVIDLLIDLNQQEPGRYRLVAVGAVHSPSCHPGEAAHRIRSATGRGDLFVHVPPVSHAQVLEHLRAFDYFLFFSTSNLEVLGRVLVEATHAGVPVLAADHAAAPELLAPSSLLDVAYYPGKPFHSHFDAPLGAVDVHAAARKIRLREQLQAPPRAAINRPEVLMATLTGRPERLDAPAPALAPAQARFVRQLRWEGLPRFGSQQAAGAVIETALDWFLALNGKAGADFDARLRELERRSRFPDRTHRFLAGCRTTRCDFTNLGGIDIELCNILGYHPTFALGGETAAPAFVGNATIGNKSGVSSCQLHQPG